MKGTSKKAESICDIKVGSILIFCFMHIFTDTKKQTYSVVDS